MTGSGRPASVLWFRRDLRLHDHPALAAAADEGPVTGLFVLDDALLRGAGPARTAFLYRTLRALDQDLRAHDGALTIRRGRPQDVVPAVAAETRASAVHITADFAPHGAARDRRVATALGDVPLVPTGSPYAVAPSRITNAEGRGYQVFSAYYRAWRAHGWPRPARSDPASVQWKQLDGEPIPDDPPVTMPLPDAGEQAARAAWEQFRRNGLQNYADARNRPDLDGTSRMSPHLKFGSIHPRTLLAGLSAADDAYRRQLAWREFYAVVLHFWPASAHGYFRPEMARMVHDTGPQARAGFTAWQQGRTGYPLVDAGMRQLLHTGWMHNRVRMVTASFLVKDLHLEWTWGAWHFMRHLLDADIANNQHGWQWTAGTGTDPAPYFRIFNPIAQAQRFDPHGTYIRRWVPELADVSDDHIHQPWRAPGGPPAGYPMPMVDHGIERAESLARYQALSRS